MARIIGESLKARDNDGRLKVSIATIFPSTGTIVTVPGIHATQRAAYIDFLNGERAAAGKAALSEDEEFAEMLNSVDLFIKEQGIFIRPDPTRMDLAFAADEILQEEESKHRIKYLLLTDKRVRDPLKQRGECWRIFVPPTEPLQIRKLILEARAAIDGIAIYYYSPVTGTRWITYDNLCRLATLDDAALRKHLVEIATYINRRNHNESPEIGLFMAMISSDDLDFEGISTAVDCELRARFEVLCEKFRAAVPPEYQLDNLDDPIWRNRMFGLLMTPRDETLVDTHTMGLDPDFSIRVEWLPGGRIEEGELILDPAIDEPRGGKPGLEDWQGGQASSIVQKLILNLVQDNGDMEYINIGSVLPSADRNQMRTGRRDVFVVQIKLRGVSQEVLQIIRMQKWGVRERLDEMKSLEDAMLDAEEYTEYVLDRRLACRQLGMNLPRRHTTRKVPEIYDGYNRRYAGYRIWTPYLQRDYISGVGTNQVSPRKLGDDAYAIVFARLLGMAAASNIILGRAEIPESGGRAIFDVGDEIVVQDANGLPVEIVVADHVGTFVDYEGPLETRAGEYATSISRRLPFVPHPEAFIGAFLTGFVEKFIRSQDEYRSHKRGFDRLFKHRPGNERGSPPHRWACVLQRMQNANPRALAELIRAKIVMPGKA